MTNCPNCGAALSYEDGLHCDYCGSVFDQPSRDLTFEVYAPEIDKTEFIDCFGNIVMSVQRTWFL